MLSANRSMLDSIKAFAEEGGTVYAECGGFMYLTDGIIDFDGNFIRWQGISHKGKDAQKRKALGYVEVEYLKGTLSKIRGHEFPLFGDRGNAGIGSQAYRVNKPGSADTWAEGYRYKNTLASYVHLHFGSNKEWAERLFSHGFTRTKL